MPVFSQIVSSNEKAEKLFDCTSDELIGKKLSYIFKKTSQVLDEALEEIFLLEDGSVTAVTGKVVINIKTNKKSALQTLFCGPPPPNYFIPYAYTFGYFWVQVDVVTSSGEVPVSVCTYKQSEHWIMMVESVERVPAFLTFSQNVGQTLSNCFFFFVATFFRHLHVILLFVKLLLTLMNSLPNFLTPRAIS